MVEGVARSIRVAVEEFGAQAVLLPLWPNRDEEMLEVIAKAAVKMGVPDEAMLRAELEHTPGKFAGYVGRADMLVSMRLHALIFAAPQGVPSIALSYARKVRGFMSELGFERWVVEIERKMPDPDEMVAIDCSAGRPRPSAEPWIADATAVMPSAPTTVAAQMSATLRMYFLLEGVKRYWLTG